jgi:rhodanese-related sulfurtransferase
MPEKRMTPSPENPEHSADEEGCIVKQLCPKECRDLVERFSGMPSQDTSADGKCLEILDLRTPQEYGTGHLKGSINLDFRSSSFIDQIAMLDRDNAYLLYCRTGIRSGRALLLMMSLGFRRLYNLTKGIEQWQREGYEVVIENVHEK